MQVCNGVGESIYEDSDGLLNLPKELKLLRQYYLLTKEKIETFLKQSGLTEGMHVMDLGCGPAFTLELFRKIVGPSGSVTLVEPNVGFKDLVEPQLGPNERFLIGSGESKGDEFRCQGNSGGYDFVVMTNVLLFLTDIEEVLTTVRDRLRSGGRIVIFDFFPGSQVILSKHQSLTQAVLKPDMNCSAIHCQNILTDCGFVVCHIDNYVMQDKPGSLLWDACVNGTSRCLLQVLRSRGSISDAEEDAVTRELEMISEDKMAILFSDLVIQISAEKP